MRRTGWLIVLLLVGALGVSSAVGARSSVIGVRSSVIGARSSAASRRSACDLGRASSYDAAAENTVLAQARSRFERSLRGVAQRAKLAAGARFVTDLAAYLYGYPIVIVRETITIFPHNAMLSIGKLADTNTRSIVAPNHDTLYSVARIDLSDGPVVVQTPPTHGRYSVIQLTDGFTNVAGYIGDGAAAATGESAAVVPTRWHGALPAGLRVVRPATKLVWLLGRTLASGSADTAAATRLLSHYSLTPLAAYEARTRTPPVILPGFPNRPPVQVPAGTKFFDALGMDLAADPPPARDACALRAFASAGIGPGRTPSVALTGLDASVLAAAARAGKGVLHALVERVRHEPTRVINGWETTPPDTARFGRDYVGRAVVAAIALGANTIDKALYLTEDRDSANRPLTGSHVYRLHFRAGHLPPVSAFWSLTLYDQRILFYANPLNRYALGDRSPGLRRDADGGLTITVSHRAPGSARRSNWLPAPAGPFSLYLRLYEPGPAATGRTWMPPSVVRSAGSAEPGTLFSVVLWRRAEDDPVELRERTPGQAQGGVKALRAEFTGVQGAA